MIPSVNFERQPRKAYRFKYLSEKRRPELEADKKDTNQTVYPQIKMIDPFRRSGIIKLTCVCSKAVKDEGYYVHPNKIHLLGEDGASIQEFVINYEFSQSNYDENNAFIMNLEKIWIEHVITKCKKIKKVDAKTALKGKKKKEKSEKIINFVERYIKNCIKLLDPYQLGYDEKRKINFDELRLCCVVEFTDGTKLLPIVSDIIKNTEVEVVDLAYNYGKVSGGTEMCIMVKNLKIKKDEEIIVRFIDAETGWLVDEALSRNHCNRALFVIVPGYQQKSIIISKSVTFFLCKKFKNETERITFTHNTFTYTPENSQLDGDEDDDGIVETIQVGQNQREALKHRFQQIDSPTFSFSNNGNVIPSITSTVAVEQEPLNYIQIQNVTSEIDGYRMVNDSIDAQMNQNMLSINNGYELYEVGQFLDTDFLDNEFKQIESQIEDQENNVLFVDGQTEGGYDNMDISNCSDTENPEEEIISGNLESSSANQESTDGDGTVDSSSDTTNSLTNDIEPVLPINEDQIQIDKLSSSPNTLQNAFNFFFKYL